MPIYEYRCDKCGKRSSALLSSYSAPDPECPHCGARRLRRLVSTFATVRSEEGAGDFGGGDDFGGGGDFGDGGDGNLGGGDWGGGDDDDF